MGQKKVVRLLLACVALNGILPISCKNGHFAANEALQDERLLVWENPDSAWVLLQEIDTSSLNVHEREIYRMEYELALSRTQHTPYYTETIANLLPTLLESGDATAIGEAYYMLGTSSNHTSRYEESTAYLKRAEEWLSTERTKGKGGSGKTKRKKAKAENCETVLREQLLGVTWFCLGNTSESEMLYPIAQAYYRKAIPMLRKRENNIFLACAYRDMARTNYLSGGSQDSTVLWFGSAAMYARKARSEVLGADIAAYYYQYCQPDSVDARLEVCRLLAEEYKVTTRYAEMVEIYLSRNETDSAAHYLTRLQPVDSTYSYWYEQNYAYWSSRIASAHRNDAKAYAILQRLYDQTVKELQSDASARTFAIAQHYDVEREQKKAEEAQREQRWHKQLSAILVLTLAVTLLLLVLLYLYYRAKRREQATQMQALRDKYIQQLQLALERLQQKVSLTREIEMQRMRGKEVEFPKWLETYRNEKLMMNKESLSELIESVDKALDGAIKRLRDEYPQLTESDMQFAILSIIGATDNDMSILLNVQKQTIYHRRQIVRKHIAESYQSEAHDEQGGGTIDDIDAWLRQYVLKG